MSDRNEDGKDTKKNTLTFGVSETASTEVVGEESEQSESDQSSD
jgi:hypothetical protein